MNESIRDIIDILELSDAVPLHFLPYSKMGGKLSYCTCDPKIQGIYFADLRANDLYNVACKGKPYEIEYVINKYGHYFPSNESPSYLIYTTWTVLHEYGHWIDFLGSKMTNEEYNNFLRRGRKEVEAGENDIKSLSEEDPQKSILAKKYLIDYYSLPSENIAEKYVALHFKEKYKLVIDRILKPLAYMDSLIGL